jgi:hypothetical protein
MAYATVRAATSPELTYLRTAGQWSRLYLAVFKPATVYSARLSSVPSSSDRVAQISFTGGSGTLANVRKDMTLYVGSTAGAYDIGVARIRKAPIAGTFYIGEESDINWSTVVSGGIYLTVVNEFDLWARHINTVSDTDFRMDYDITYSNQNETFDPVPVMGGHRVVKLTGSSVATVWDFSNSWVIGSTITGYSVSCPTSSSITGGTTATPTINFNATGWHPVYLTVTAANAKTYTSMRYVYVYSAASMPSVVFQLGDCSVDYDTGGWSFDVTVQAGIALADVPERALCILFAEDYYGSTQTSIGQLAGCENILAVGKIAEEHIQIDPEQSEINLTIHGMHYWLGKTNAFPAGVLATSGSPTNWAEMQDPTVQKVLYLLLHWGSTATTIMDVYLTTDARTATELASPTSNLWAQMQEIAFSSIHARPGVDRFGRLFVEIEPQMVPAGSRTWATVMTITKQDWHSAVSVERVVVTPTGRVDLSGIVATSSDDGQAIFSLSPGHVFKHYGDIEVIDRLLLSTQSLSNQEAGLVLGWRNNPYPSVEFPLAANNRMIDCFPRQKVAWSIASGDTPRAFSLSGNFVPRRVALRWDADTGFIETELSAELESVEQISTNGDIPGETGAINIPPVPPLTPFPPLPPIIIPGEITDSYTMKAIVMAKNHGLFYTENFNELPGSRVKWRAINGGLTSTQYLNIDTVLRSPFTGGIYVARRGNHADFFLAYAAYPGAPFTILETRATVQSKFGTSSTDVGLCSIGIRPDTGQVGYVIGFGTSSMLRLGTGVSFINANGGATFVNWNAARGNIHFDRDGNWVISGHDTSSAAIIRLSSIGAFETIQAVSNFYATFSTARGMQSNFYMYPFLTTSNIVNLADNTGGHIGVGDDIVNSEWDYQFACDPTGQYCMFRWDTAEKGRSSDSMSSIQAMPNLPPGGQYGFTYIGGGALKSHWAAAGGSVWYSKDFGDNWSDQRGDLLQMAPTGGHKLIKAWF